MIKTIFIQMVFSQFYASCKQIRIFIAQQITASKQKRAITAFDIIIFLRQFATLISAGIPIIQSCEILEKSQEKLAIRLLIYAIKRDMLSGKNLFYSLKSHPHYFDELTCQLIQIGEHTGKLDMMLTTLAHYKEKHLAFKRRLQQALFYPCLITITAFGVTLGMLIFVIPRFAELFQNVQGLPRLTLWIFYLSAKLQAYFWPLISCLLLMMLTFFQKKFSAHALHSLTHCSIKLPFIKQFMYKIVLARFARNLALTFAAGIPITEALKLTANIGNHSNFADMIAKLRNKISGGLQLHHAMQAFPSFPLLMIQMVKIGEESGMLEQMLEKIADFFESDIDQFIGRLSQLLEPLLMIVLGVLIGGLVVGMYLPIFKLGNAI